MAPTGFFAFQAQGGRTLTEERELTVGQYLRQERERKNISLESISKVTRITLANLEALERDDFQAFSASVFARGFLRTYASQLGLDPREVLSRYEAQVSLPAAPAKTQEASPPGEGSPLGKYLLFLGFLIAGVAIAFFFYQKPSVPTVPSSVLPPPSRMEKPSGPGVLSLPAEVFPERIESERTRKPLGELLAAPPALIEGEKKKEEKHSLKVVATEKTWLRILTPDQSPIDVLLQPKETATWTSRGPFNIIVGNAGGVELFFNGASQGLLGKSGQVVHLQLPKETNPPGEEQKKP